MRSLLFVPGNKANMLAKAAGLAPDVLVPDMEDSVPDAEKTSARSTIAEWLPRLTESRLAESLPRLAESPPPLAESLPRLAAHPVLVMPRVNSLRTDWFDDDVAAVAVPGVFGISIGKVESPADLSRVSDALARAERKAGLDDGSLRLVPWIETARAVVNCHEICTASERIVAVAFGGEDYTADLGIERLDDESNLIYARSAICNAARAAGVLALDTPWFRFRDRGGLESSSIAAKRLGFKGRFAIHPDQIETINACFSPSRAEIEEARRIVAAFEAAERDGRGSTSLDGRVIDVPVVKRARAVLEQAGSVGQRVP